MFTLCRLQLLMLHSTVKRIIHKRQYAFQVRVHTSVVLAYVHYILHSSVFVCFNLWRSIVIACYLISDQIILCLIIPTVKHELLHHQI